ncbi:MAG: universal stress protein [Paracoccaceae bacterium]
MAYKSLLTVLTDTQLAPAPLEQSIALAAKLDAHVDVLSLGLDRSQIGYYYAGANAMILQETINRAQAEVKDIDTFATTRMKCSNVLWACDTAVAALADLGRHVAAPARFADLVILAQPYGADQGPEVEAVVEAALFEGRVPVLVTPPDIEPLTKPRRIVVGWNQSNEALTAIRAATPFLVEADIVHIAVIDPPSHGQNRSDPGGTLSRMLSRHGVSCEIDVLSKTMPRVSDILARHVSDIDADLLVMGAYGHSRLREAILGGATRNMLEQTNVPVFMAH